jgi:CBS domain-containing protein
MDNCVSTQKTGSEVIKAKQLMTTNVITVTKETPITTVARLLLEHNITGVPVVEEDMTLVGMVTEKDVLKLLYAGQEAKAKTVEEFMTRPAIHFDEEESLRDIADCLINYDFRRVPITSGAKVVGVISRHDILNYVVQTQILEPVS